MTTPRRRRLTRATLLAGAAGGVVAVPLILRGGFGGGSHKEHKTGFASLPDAKGWPEPWLAQHYLRDLRVTGGRGTFTLPAGLDTTAPAQPMPVFLIDRVCAGATHGLDFSVTNPTLRPGILFAATSDVDYLAVTCERHGLVLARYGRDGRVVIADGPHPPLATATPYHLRVVVHSGGVRAKVWKAARAEPAEWHLTSRVAGPVNGTPGVVVVHPTNFAAATLAVSAHTIAAETPFGPTPPVAAAQIAGVPLLRPDGRYDVRLRAISAYPARVTIHARTAAGARAFAYEVAQPPYTALHLLQLEPGERLDWHVELESATSGARTVSPPQEVLAPHADERLVLLAASCEQFSGEPPARTYAAMVEAAPARPAALVFQGDLGYANNSFHSCYISAPDFFADRFRRTLAGHDFAALRARIPTGFTIDDHDYGPQNNADRTTYAHWAPPLWARIHADPDPTGYFDFRFGDVHSLTLDVRRYADPVLDPNTPAKTRIGERQFAWMQHILETSDAKLFVIFSAGIFASRYKVTDCWLTGYPNEYDRAMRLFLDVQARGPRVLILSGDAHGLRIHHHPYPQRIAPRGASVIEFICSGVRARMWSGAQLPDPTLDKRRNVLFRYGGGLADIDPPATPQRQITLRAISGNIGRPGDLFPPLVLPFQPVQGL